MKPLNGCNHTEHNKSQPPSGGCVLKLYNMAFEKVLPTQPPSGGCVLKLIENLIHSNGKVPAAFGRLCVETKLENQPVCGSPPAAFGRLCVETEELKRVEAMMYPAAFGRLCVETKNTDERRKLSIPAAFGRLCVETFLNFFQFLFQLQPPSGGCVLKLLVGLQMV